MDRTVILQFNLNHSFNTLLHFILTAQKEVDTVNHLLVLQTAESSSNVTLVHSQRNLCFLFVVICDGSIGHP